MKCILSITALLAMLFFQSLSYAQEEAASDTTQEGFLSKNFRVAGEIGAYGELYNITGQPNRRPSSTARLYFRPTVVLFNTFSIPFEFLISTEGNSARQNINQFGINPKWSWGSAHLGDFTETYSDLSLNGILIRGGGLTLNPGLLRISATAGFTQRAVNGGATNGSFERFLLGARLGVGEETGSFVDLLVLRSKDNIGSLIPGGASITIQLPNGDDAIPIGTVQTVRWSSVNLASNVRIELSRDGGRTYELLFADWPNTGAADWTVTGPETFQALLRVTSLADSAVSDLSDYPFTIGAGISPRVGERMPTVANESAVTPQENLVIGTVGKLQFAQNRITVRFEAMGSVYTRDMRANEISVDSLKLPNFLKDVYKPRVGTNADFALNGELGLALESVSARVGYKFIGPGYQSLGLPYLLNDQQEITALTSIRLSPFVLTANWMRLSDNLVQQKSFTTVRNMYMLSLNGMVADFWNAGIMANVLGMQNDSKSDTTRIDFSNLVIGTNQTFIASQTSFLRNISASYTHQRAENKSVLLKNAKTTTNSLNIGASFGILESMSATLSAGLVGTTTADTIKTTTRTYAIGGQHRAFDNNLTTTLTLGTSVLEQNTSTQATLTSSFLLTSSDMISLMLSLNRFRGSSQTGGEYNESIVSMTISHRF